MSFDMEKAIRGAAGRLPLQEEDQSGDRLTPAEAKQAARFLELARGEVPAREVIDLVLAHRRRVRRRRPARRPGPRSLDAAIRSAAGRDGRGGALFGLLLGRAKEGTR